MTSAICGCRSSPWRTAAVDPQRLTLFSGTSITADAAINAGFQPGGAASVAVGATLW